MSTFELIKTEGYGLEVVFSFNGRTYQAMDDFSGFDPEKVDFDAPEFSIVCPSDQSWESIFQGNPELKRELIQRRGWSYDGYGQVVSVRPVVVDFGDFTFEVGDFTTDQRCIGEFVHLILDRLDLAFASQ
jgi:hypothetical protein